ncbi:outer membrane protein assembly factor BamB family protein [Rhabdothermincola sediminis]|uniref:outer membrane protein assembly factor BamB family protein n=1 Tax=Rhabdothermincola sediminis TaxID=2751370 RepID=UPI001AA07830|nr:PQQ-binding-like beta-propeller repeat protein [Rhabdothermincola sediminis]
MQSRRAIAGLLAASLALAACRADPPAFPAADPGPVAGAGECDWPMWGHNLARTFAYPCETALSTATVADLELAWFFNTYDVVTATPAIVDGTAYVGDWSGRFYAVDVTTGEARWTFQAATEPNVYAGQIVSSAAVADIDGVRTVVFGSGRTVHALRADTGEERWSHAVGTDDPQDFTEIESSPAIADGKVLVGTDVHNRPGQQAGLLALDAGTGQRLWFFDPDQGQPPQGCADVWGSPSVDLERRTVFVGTANCPRSPDGWGPYTEALVAVDLDTGEPRWAFQPHEPNNDDLDFAGAPNLFRARGRDLVGLGNKDGTYYAVDRDTGKLVWKAKATEPGIEEPGANFSTGGFIGGTAYAEGIIAGGTAVGPPPFVHAIDAANGKILWQDAGVQAIYGSAAVANGVLFIGGNDFTLRAYDLRTGEVLWSHEMRGVVAGGPVVVGDSLYAVAGIREPGLDARSETSGLYRFVLRGRTPGMTQPAPTTSTTAERATGVVLAPNVQPCMGSPCDMFRAGITLRRPPGLSPTATLEVQTDPFRVTFQGEGLGRPEEWLQPGSPAAQAGATMFGLFISERDDNPVGGVLCILDEDYRCSTDSLPARTSYNRITLLALASADTMPTPADGAARLLVTVSFDPPLTPVN